MAMGPQNPIPSKLGRTNMACRLSALANAGNRFSITNRSAKNAQTLTLVLGNFAELIYAKKLLKNQSRWLLP
jgi:hypothetical protein